MGLIVALGDGPSHSAHGSLFWDDGESFGNISFYAASIWATLGAGCVTFVIRARPITPVCVVFVETYETGNYLLLEFNCAQVKKRIGYIQHCVTRTQRNEWWYDGSQLQTVSRVV